MIMVMLASVASPVMTQLVAVYSVAVGPYFT